jgi:hypothetical protein
MRKTQPRIHRRRPAAPAPLSQLRVWAMFSAGAISLVACTGAPQSAQQEAPLVVTQPLAAAAAATADEQSHDRPSPPAISAIWTGSAGETASLVARLQNTTPEMKVVTLKLVGVDPYGLERERPLGKRTLAPRSALDLPIAVRTMPVQSTGHASTVALAVTYDLPVLGPDGVKQQISHTIHSSPAYLTFSDDFLKATARTVGEEARASGAAAGKAARGLPKVRHYDPASDLTRDVQTQFAGDDAPALLGVTDVAPAAMPASDSSGANGGK